MPSRVDPISMATVRFNKRLVGDLSSAHVADVSDPVFMWAVAPLRALSHPPPRFIPVKRVAGRHAPVQPAHIAVRQGCDPWHMRRRSRQAWS